jgi:hypothetical protein
VEIMSYQMMHRTNNGMNLGRTESPKKKLTWIGHLPPEEAL